MNVLRCAWIATMDRPPIADGAVAFDNGTMRFVGTWPEIRAHAPSASVHDLGDTIILPGLVNAHTHIELSDIDSRMMPRYFVDWVLGLRAKAPIDDAHIVDAVAQGVRQCLRAGVSAAGDISLHASITRPLLSRGPLRVVSYGEALGIGQNRRFFGDRLSDAADERLQSEFLCIGISPHAPYSVDPHDFKTAVDLARSRSLPLATHLAEHFFEREFLEHHTGPLRELLERLGAWSDSIETAGMSPIAFARSAGLLDGPSLLAHVNYCSDDELAMLASGNASVVYCPRTHRHFDHPRHRWREMLDAGINVAIGTDSCASSPDLNLVEELRLLHRLAPEVDSLTIWQLATTRAAIAIQQPRAGSLSPGQFADFAVFPALAGSDPLKALLESEARASALWINGRPVSIDE